MLFDLEYILLFCAKCKREYYLFSGADVSMFKCECNLNQPSI